jgi:hypothetical protein
VWVTPFSSDPSVALYVIAGVLLVGALVAWLLIPRDLTITTGAAPSSAKKTSSDVLPNSRFSV